MYLCHAGEKEATSKQVETQTCETDDDCTSYCEDDPTKTPPYYCHAIGGTCGKGMLPRKRFQDVKQSL